MHPTISYCVAQARIADLHHHAERDTVARAVRGPGLRRRPGPHALGTAQGTGRARRRPGRRSRRRTR